MAVYTWDITNREVLQAVAHPNPTNPSQPDNTALTAWVKRFAARVNSALKGINITAADVTSSSDADLYELCRQQVIARVGCEWLMHNQHAVPEHAQVALDDWAGFLEDLRRRPTHTVGATSHGLTPSTGPERSSTTGELTNSSARRPSDWSRKLSSEGFG